MDISQLNLTAIPQVLFWISIISSLSIVFLTIAASLTRKFHFYPPPKKEGWQHPTFLWLFRGFLYPLIILSILKFHPVETLWDMIRITVGPLLLVIGFALAFWITFQMGWRNAFGEKKGLITTGWFHWSRNPIYVITWIGLIGWSLTVQQWQVTILVTIWAVLYLFAPFLEEPWLEKMYGQAYLEYKAETPRFWRPFY